MKELKPLDYPKWETIKDLSYAKIGIANYELELANGNGHWIQRLKIRILGRTFLSKEFTKENYKELCQNVERYRNSIYQTMEELC